MEEETCFLHHRHHSAFPVILTNGFLNGECLGLTMSVFVCTHDRCRSSCQLLRLFLPMAQQSCSTGCQNGFPATGEQPPTGKPPKRPQSPTRSKQMPPNLHAAALYPRSRRWTLVAFPIESHRSRKRKEVLVSGCRSHQRQPELRSANYLAFEGRPTRGDCPQGLAWATEINKVILLIAL